MNKKDFLKNVDNLDLSDEAISFLNSYQGVLPKFLLIYINILEYKDNLRKSGVYKDVYSEYYQIRIERLRSSNKDKYDKDELKEWIDDNPEFLELI